LASWQLRGVVTHEPLTQRASIVHASLSAQSPLVKQQLGTAVCAQPVGGLQASMVHGLPSLQSGTKEGSQAPL